MADANVAAKKGFEINKQDYWAQHAVSFLPLGWFKRLLPPDYCFCINILFTQAFYFNLIVGSPIIQYIIIEHAAS
jgi:hypothetical protein